MHHVRCLDPSRRGSGRRGGCRLGGVLAHRRHGLGSFAGVGGGEGALQVGQVGLDQGRAM
ncbi:hypothetical protein [Promicromonospora xylanilytica]